MQLKSMCIIGQRLINFILMKASSFIDQDGGKSKLKSTGASVFHKAVGRETSAAWGNRIVKDFYDLDYDMPSTFSRLNQNFKSKDKQQRKRVRADIKKTKLSHKKMSMDEHATIQPDPKSSKEKPIMQKKVSYNNPEVINIGPLAGSGPKELGLCPFQYQNTIQGKMQKRLNHHISFQKNKVDRIVNEYPIYYNRHQDLDFTHSQLMHERKMLQTYHPFSSYTERSVFEPREQLDKFFDTDEGLRAASPRRLKEAVRKFERVFGRKQPNLNQSVRLAYETLPVVLKLKKRSTSYSIKKTEKDFTFTRQIFSQRRGCYR